MRKMCVLSLAALFFLTCDFAQSQTVKVLSKWVGGPVKSRPLISAAAEISEHKPRKVLPT